MRTNMNPRAWKVTLEIRMKFLLITPNGRVYTFHLQSVAEMYQKAYGGTLTSEYSTTTEESQPPGIVDQAGQVFLKSLTIRPILV